VAGGPPAAGQISGAASSTTGSSGPSNTVNGFTGFSASLTIDDGTTLQSRYAFNVNADIGTLSTWTQTGSARHNVSFDATAPAGYRLDIATRRTGDLNRINDVSGCNGSADVSSVLGSSNVPPSSGSLHLVDPGFIPLEPVIIPIPPNITESLPFNQTGSATIFGVSNGVAQSHSLTFDWSASVSSQSCEVAVRMGQQNGTTTSCTACGYPGSPARTQSNDGHFVTVTFTSLCGNGVVDAQVSEQCDQGAANGSSESCCTVTCQLRGAGQVCRPSQGVCDVEDVCNGSSGACADVKSTAPCRSAVGACDVAESCNGLANDCPADAKSTAVCRAAVNGCDVAESCDGVADWCPADGVQSDGTPCSDNDVCSDGDLCGAGVCEPGPPLDCDDSDPCTADSCEGMGARGGCMHEPIPSCGAAVPAASPWGRALLAILLAAATVLLLEDRRRAGARRERGSRDGGSARKERR
jgi:hypothetical protein